MEKKMEATVVSLGYIGNMALGILSDPHIPRILSTQEGL